MTVRLVYHVIRVISFIYENKSLADPVLNSRYLLYEAQQAHYYGLSENLALASVISAPAQIMGMDHRIGFIKAGYDADLVLWDSHPLALGATPRQVFIDGIAQFDKTFSPPAQKPTEFQKAPETPDFEKEAADALKYEGLPPLEPEKSISGTVAFTNLSTISLRSIQGSDIVTAFEAESADEYGTLVIQAGKVACLGSQSSCAEFLARQETVVVDLKGGAVSPGLTSFGSNLGLEEIQGEASTKDGAVYDPLDKEAPGILGKGALIRAADGLQFATRHA